MKNPYLSLTPRAPIIGSFLAALTRQTGVDSNILN